MSIESLRIQGFRSLRDVTWKPGRLNVLIGPNGSGKSNLVEGLDLLRLAADETLRRTILSLGGPNALAWDSNVHSISWEIGALDVGSHLGLITYLLSLEVVRGSQRYWVEHELLRMEDIVHLDRTRQSLQVRDEMTGLRAFSEEKIGDEESVLGNLTFNSSDIHLFHMYLTSWKIYQGLRVDRRAPVREAAVASLESHLAPDGQNLIPVLHTLYTGNREFKRGVDSAMRAAFGEDYEELVFPPAADQRVQLRIRWRSLKTEQSAANLSDGTLRFLMLLAILANPDPAPLIAIDEPETGLHPGMFPLIAELAAEAAEKTQVIFTTHSPQFLDAFTEEAPTTTVAQLVDGETRLSVLDGEELNRWLKEYSLGDLFQSGELEGMA
jgi:predicted ATPase